MLTNSASLLKEPSGFPDKKSIMGKKEISLQRAIRILALFGCTYKSTSKQMSVESETMYVTHPTENVLQHKVTALKMWIDCVRQVSHCVSCSGPTNKWVQKYDRRDEQEVAVHAVCVGYTRWLWRSRWCRPAAGPGRAGLVLTSPLPQ